MPRTGQGQEKQETAELDAGALIALIAAVAILLPALWLGGAILLAGLLAAF
jgi:hypothetical protein